MSWLLPLALGVAAAAWGICGIVRRAGARAGLLDIPNIRSSHAAPVPRGGGLGIVIAVLAALAALPLVARPLPSIITLALLAGGGAIAIVSFVDDRRDGGVPAMLRLAVHLGAAALLVAIAGSPQAIRVPLVSDVPLAWMAVPGAIVWLAGMTNAYNFMDGIDGIAGTQAVTAAAGWAVAGWMIGREDLMVAGTVVAAACAGFLLHNWHPARLFMGDVGSAFLGFVLAAMPLFARDGRLDARFALAGVLMLWPFAFDTAFTLARRLRRGERITEAHRSHLYQRLTGAGWGHQRVTMLYAVLAAAGAVLGAAMIARGSAIDAPAALYLAGAPLAVWLLVRREERRASP